MPELFDSLQQANGEPAWRTQPIKLGGQAPQLFVEQALLEASKTSRKPVKHTTRKRSAVFSQEKEGPASDSDPDLEESPYLRRASKLFKRLDQEFVKSKDRPAQLGVAQRYTVRFARPATLTIVGSRQHNLPMPELFDRLQQANGGQHGGVYLNGQEETDHSKKWDPTGLLANEL
uniref:Uncharacterized protein n=1 Tax=Ditylenchus dipsaci TaxID=166011 RepID=A0A915DZI4_9BILA